VLGEGTELKAHRCVSRNFNCKFKYWNGYSNNVYLIRFLSFKRFSIGNFNFADCFRANRRFFLITTVSRDSARLVRSHVLNPQSSCLEHYFLWIFWLFFIFISLAVIQTRLLNCFITGYMYLVLIKTVEIPSLKTTALCDVERGKLLWRQPINLGYLRHVGILGWRQAKEGRTRLKDYSVATKF